VIPSETQSAKIDTDSTAFGHRVTVPSDPGEFAAFDGNPDFVLSLARGLRVIESFEGHTEGQSVADVARFAKLSRAAARRSLITLEMLGYVESAGRTYRLKTRILKLGFSYLASNSLPAMAQPTLERITELVHESSSLSVLEATKLCTSGARQRSGSCRWDFP